MATWWLVLKVYAYDDPSNSCESYTPGMEWKQMALKLAAAGHYQLERTWSIKTEHDGKLNCTLSYLLHSIVIATRNVGL